MSIQVARHEFLNVLPNRPQSLELCSSEPISLELPLSASRLRLNGFLADNVLYSRWIESVDLKLELAMPAGIQDWVVHFWSGNRITGCSSSRGPIGPNFVDVTNVEWVEVGDRAEGGALLGRSLRPLFSDYLPRLSAVEQQGDSRMVPLWGFDEAVLERGSRSVMVRRSGVVR